MKGRKALVEWLSKQDTLLEGFASNLKLQFMSLDGNIELQVWLSRLTREDGMRVDNPISITLLKWNDPAGAWELMNEERR